jgi:hypothetical protein
MVWRWLVGVRSPLLGVSAALCLAAVAGCGSPAATSSAAATATAGAAAGIPVTLSDAGCTPNSFSLHPGSIIFTVTNSGSTKVEEMEVQDQQGHVRGDVEGVQPGQTRSFVLDLTAGVYNVKCPQDATVFGTLTVG